MIVGYVIRSLLVSAARNFHVARTTRNHPLHHVFRVHRRSKRARRRDRGKGKGKRA